MIFGKKINVLSCCFHTKQRRYDDDDKLLSESDGEVSTVIECKSCRSDEDKATAQLQAIMNCVNCTCRTADDIETLRSISWGIKDIIGCESLTTKMKQDVV